MSGSLSVVLPVLNAERTLAKNLEHVLEVLSDLRARFEVLIVDQGSTDQTADVAHEMAVTFPQLRVAQRRLEPSEPSGWEADLHQTTGEFVFVHQGHIPFNVNDFRRLWEICRAQRDGLCGAETAGLATGPPGLVSTTEPTSLGGPFLGLRCELGGIHALLRRRVR